MDYGAVCITYYSSEQYYNPNTASQYCPSKFGTNHAVTIVGWDDEYKRENFKDTPTEDGAWLVKNSWGKIWGAIHYETGSSVKHIGTPGLVLMYPKTSEHTKRLCPFATE